MLHAYIRMHDDVRFWAGYLAHLTDQFEYLIESTTILVSHMLREKNDLSTLRFVEKINRFVCVLKEGGPGRAGCRVVPVRHTHDT